MAAVIKGVYKRKKPEQTDYYRILEHFFDDFSRTYSDSIEDNYGYLKQDVKKAVFAFLDCGIPENGVARVRCDGCGSDFFVAFSCKKRNVCPSCTTKRSLLFAEKVSDIIKPINHLHITFTIPKILRPYFRRNRKLLKLFVQSANYAVNKYFRESLRIKDGLTGGIYYIQTYGDLYNFNPHVHGIVCGGIEKDAVFYEQQHIETRIIGEIFRRRLLTLLLKKEIIDEERAEMVLSWNHNSGFNVHAEGRINGNDKEAIENIARYLSRTPISVERIEYDPQNNKVIVYKKAGKNSFAESKSYTLEEFLSLVVSHIPHTYEPLVYYCGIYSSSHRGKEIREQTNDKELKIQEIEVKKGIKNGKIISSWARLIHRIFEVNPLQCSHCGGEMRIIAFIIDEFEIRSILRHIKEETIRPPPLKPAVNNKYYDTDYIYVYDYEIENSYQEY